MSHGDVIYRREREREKEWERVSKRGTKTEATMLFKTRAQKSRTAPPFYSWASRWVPSTCRMERIDSASERKGLRRIRGHVLKTISLRWLELSCGDAQGTFGLGAEDLQTGLGCRHWFGQTLIWWGCERLRKMGGFGQGVHGFRVKAIAGYAKFRGVDLMLLLKC